MTRPASLSRPCFIAVARRIVTAVLRGLDELADLQPGGGEVSARTVVTLDDGTVVTVEARRPA